MTELLCVHVGENRHGSFGAHSRDGYGDNPLLLQLNQVLLQRSPRRALVGASLVLLWFSLCAIRCDSQTSGWSPGGRTQYRTL